MAIPLTLVLNKVGRWLAALFAVLMLATALAPASANALSDGQNCDKSANSFFGLEPWFQYLPYQYNGTTKRCEVNFSQNQVLGKNSAILLIILAVVDDLLRVAGIVAVVFVIVGGFKYITSNGEPEAAASAKNSILYALIGLVIALIAVVIVSFIGNRLGA